MTYSNTIPVRTKTSTKASTSEVQTSINKRSLSPPAPLKYAFKPSSRSPPAPNPSAAPARDQWQLRDSSGSDDSDPDFGREAIQKDAEVVAVQVNALKAITDGAGTKRRRSKEESVGKWPGVSTSEENPSHIMRLERILGGGNVERSKKGPEESGAEESDEAPVRGSSGMHSNAPKRRKGKHGKKPSAAVDSDESEDTIEAVKKHLSGKWRKKDNSYIMDRDRRKMELKYNPLIKLLDIDIKITTLASDSDSDGPVNSKKLKKAESSDDEEECIPRPKAISSSTPWTATQPSPRSKAPSIKAEFDEKVMIISDDESEQTEEEDEEPEPVKPAPPTIQEDEEALSPSMLRALENRQALQKKLEEKKMEKLRQARREEEEARRLARLAELRKAQDEKERLGQMDVDEEDEKAWQPRQPPSEMPSLPYRLTSGRPRFEIKSYQQHSTGPLELAPGVVVPLQINRFLRPYQRDGVRFLYRQYAEKSGGVLGDDMGLGKTIQVIAFLSAIMNKTGLKRDASFRSKAINAINCRTEDLPPASTHGPTCLILCPTAVLYNWQEEFETWGYFKTVIFAGKESERKEHLAQFRYGYYDVVISGIEAARNAIDRLAALDFTVVIVDEAHRVKNPKSQTTRAFLKFPTPIRFGLTGTAIQNRYSEFHTLLDWAVPGAVGTEEQWKTYVTIPLQHAQQSDSTDEQIAIGRVRSNALVQRLLPTLFLRRTKDIIKDQLPLKVDKIVLCPLTKEQKRVYESFLALPDVQTMLTIDEPCECGRTDDDGAHFVKGKCCHRGWTKMIFKYIILFQKVANHVALIYPDNDDAIRDPEKFKQDKAWTQIAFPNDWGRRTKGHVYGTETTLCGKWQVLTGLLDLWLEKKDKVLIFSMSLKVLGYINDLMTASSKDYKHLTLDGKTSPEERMKRVTQFNTDPDVFCFLISTRAGGVGLNLTGANKVVIFDPNWNPAHDLQAMDRAYRFGQTRDVDVYRLIGAGTLEELIYNRQQYKRAQANVAYHASAESRLYDGVQDDPKNKGSLWGIKNIFQLQSGFSRTKEKIEDCQAAEIEFALKYNELKASKASQKEKKKQGRSNESDLDDESDYDEPDLEADLAFLGIEDEAVVLTPAEAAAAEKKRLEQEQIAVILAKANVSYTTVSDAVLGGSKAEKYKSRAAIAGHYNIVTPAAGGPSTGSTFVRKPSVQPKIAKASTSKAPAVWDPSAPRKK